MDIICLLVLEFIALASISLERKPKDTKAYRAEIFVISIEEKEVKTNGSNSNR